MNNIGGIRNCYGCGVCAVVCPKNIISIRLNDGGFYEPRITDLDKCIDCGLCKDVCAFSHEKIAPKLTEMHSYAAWSNNSDVRRKCSSGGIGFEIGKQLIERGYKACGVGYDVKEQRAKHFVAERVDEFVASVGSKYIQSYTVDGFKAIKRREKYLVTGTPCQIDSFRRYIQRFKVEDNFILLDFFCHAVPSMLMWDKYLQLVENTTGKVTYVSWRNKFNGWHDSWLMSVDGVKSESGVSVPEHLIPCSLKERKGMYNSRFSKGDVFYNLFLKDFCCSPACQKNCKYKYDSSSADIRIGDLWGQTYRKEDKGVSTLVAFTKKGNDVIKDLQNCTLIEHPFEIVAEGQMRHNAGKALLAPLVKIMLHSNKKYSVGLWSLIIKVEAMIHFPQRVLNKIRRMIK